MCSLLFLESKPSDLNRTRNGSFSQNPGKKLRQVHGSWLLEILRAGEGRTEWNSEHGDWSVAQPGTLHSVSTESLPDMKCGEL